MISLALNTNGAVPRRNVTPSPGVSKMLSGISVGSLTDQQKNQALTQVPTGSGPSLGTNPGLINNLVYPTSGGSSGIIKGPIKSSTDISGNTVVHDTKPNPNVLAQQKELNKKGAGLVEDGITGPKTRDAIAKYGTSGTRTEDTYKTEGGATINPDGSIQSPANPEKTTPLAPVDPTSNARRVLDAGQQTPLEKTATANLYQAGQATPLESQYIDRVQEAQGMKNAGVLGPYADASLHVNDTPKQLYEGLINSPDLAGRASADRGLYDAFSNIYGSQATQGLLAANTIAGRGLTAAQSGLNGAQNTATRGLTGASDVLGTSVNPLFGGATGTLQDAVSNVVSKLTNGTMTYNDAVSALSGYGQAGLNALNQSLPTDFNVTQSNTLAGQQGTVNAAYTLADQALTNAEDRIKNLGGLQNTNVPIANSIGKKFSDLTGVGSKEVQEYVGAIQTLRNRYASLLASAKGGIPSDYSAQANSEIPDWPTPNQLSGIRATFNILGSQVKNVYGNAGTSTSGSSTGGGFAEAW